MPNSVLLFQMNFDQHTASNQSAYDHHINLFLICLLVLDFASKLTSKCFNLYHEIKKLDYCVRNPQPQKCLSYGWCEQDRANATCSDWPFSVTRKLKQKVIVVDWLKFVFCGNFLNFSSKKDYQAFLASRKLRTRSQRIKTHAHWQVLWCVLFCNSLVCSWNL